MTAPAVVLPCTCGTRLGCEEHSPQPREHAVPCQRCGRSTWAHNAVCDPCHRKENPLL